MRYWWVNQNQTYNHEVGGGYLWSPKRKSNGARNHYYEVMREVAAGDVVFSFRRKAIAAIGIAIGYAQDAIKPSEFGQAGQQWSDFGWKVPVRFTELENLICPGEHMALLGPLMSQRYAPLSADGRGLQAVYLTEVPSAFAEALIGLIGPKARALCSEVPTLTPDSFFEEDDSLHAYEQQLESDLSQDNSRPETERRQLVLARRGQGLFRRRVLSIEPRCRITGVSNPAFLQACHLKPWRNATDHERLDGANGLVLTPTMRHLVGGGFLGFHEDGELLISPIADRESLQLAGVPLVNRTLTGEFTDEQRGYLQYHRAEIFRGDD
jgi:putative restriction endonuclease